MGTKYAPIALTIAGSDSGGGAGIQADLKTFSALGVYGASVITALTAQNTQAVTAIHNVPANFIVEQLNAVLSDLTVRAIKIGMLSTVPVIEAVSRVINQHPDIPVVLDPVMVAKSGDALLQPEAHVALIKHLVPVATLVTPNLPEAAILTGTDEATDETSMQAQAVLMQQLGAKAILMKGGHLKGADSTDFLYIDQLIERHSHPRVNTGNTHGTGCTLSSAIAAGLARDMTLSQAVQAAADYVHAAISAADKLHIGNGHGPVHHFHAVWN